MLKVKTRPMTTDDIDSVVTLEEKCFSSPWQRASFENTLKNPIAGYFVTVDKDNNLLGYIGLYNLIDEVSVINVATDPESRGLGIGSGLMDKAEEFAGHCQCPKITLEVRESNRPAVSLYEKKGYLLQGREKNYYSNPKEDALLYYKEIQC